MMKQMQQKDHRNAGASGIWKARNREPRIGRKIQQRPSGSKFRVLGPAMDFDEGLTFFGLSMHRGWVIFGSTGSASEE